MAAVDAEQRKSGKIDDFGIGDILAPAFRASFAALSVLMTSKDAKTPAGDADEAKDAATLPNISSSTTGQKRTRLVSLTGLPAKRPKGEHDEDVLEEPATPDQPTKPSNPKFSS